MERMLKTGGNSNNSNNANGNAASSGNKNQPAKNRNQ
jgi:hypothetical protein